MRVHSDETIKSINEDLKAKGYDWRLPLAAEDACFTCGKPIPEGNATRHRNIDGIMRRRHLYDCVAPSESPSVGAEHQEINIDHQPGDDFDTRHDKP